MSENGHHQPDSTELTDKQKVEALRDEMGYSNEEAYFFLIDAGEWKDDETGDELFSPEFLDEFPY